MNYNECQIARKKMTIKEQTPAICLAAVKQNGYALRHVKERFLNNKEGGENETNR